LIDPIKTIENDIQSNFKEKVLPFKGLLAFFSLKTDNKISDTQTEIFLKYLAAIYVNETKSDVNKFIGLKYENSTISLQDLVL